MMLTRMATSDIYAMDNIVGLIIVATLCKWVTFPLLPASGGVPRLVGELTQPLQHLDVAATRSDIFAPGEVSRAAVLPQPHQHLQLLGAYTRPLFQLNVSTFCETRWLASLCQ